jgi:hypothetical protein
LVELLPADSVKLKEVADNAIAGEPVPLLVTTSVKSIVCGAKVGEAPGVGEKVMVAL